MKGLGSSKRVSPEPTDSLCGGMGVWGYGRISLPQALSPPTPPHSQTPIQNTTQRTKPLRLDLRPTFLACLLTLLTLGCAESVDTRLEIDRPFTVFGLINPKADTHAVRVFEIENEIRLIRPEPIDAIVSTTLMQTGEQRVWQDSVIRLDDGDYRHVYWSAFTATAGETYRLEVTRSDGEKTSAITTIPPPVTLEMLEPDTTSVLKALMPLFIHGAPPTLPRIDVEYVVVGFREGGIVPIFRPITLNYQGRAVQQTEGWLVAIDLIDDFINIFQVFNEGAEVATELIELREIHVRVHIGDENWVSPTGSFDGEFLVEPGAFSNVENGFGYFGAGYVESITFRPPAILLRRAGFYINGS